MTTRVRVLTGDKLLHRHTTLGRSQRAQTERGSKELGTGAEIEADTFGGATMRGETPSRKSAAAGRAISGSGYSQ
jgi:hypothetical protein